MKSVIVPGGGVLPCIQKELFPVQSPKSLTTSLEPGVFKPFQFTKLPARAPNYKVPKHLRPKKPVRAAIATASKLEKKVDKSKNVTTLSEKVLNKGQKVSSL